VLVAECLRGWCICRQGEMRDPLMNLAARVDQKIVIRKTRAPPK